MNGAKTVTVAEGRLFVTDRGNNRILIYNHRPLSAPAKADTVVGQEAFYRSLPGLSDNRLRLPESLCVAGVKLIVADSGNNRVLIWNSIPLTDGEAADIVLGQEDFESNTTLYPPTAASLNFPTAVWSDGNTLIVLDAGNNRILIWNSLTGLLSGDDADTVIGQKDFTSNEANMGLAEPSEYTLHFAAEGGGLYANGAQIFVTDSANHRLLIWDFPLTTEQAASGLIGQNDYNLADPYRGKTGVNTLLKPTGVYQFYRQLIITDTGNNRYLIFESND
jgi:WD40 repeat protein